MPVIGDYLLRALAVALGVTLPALAYLLYESEEGRLRSRLEHWWVRVDDAQKAALSRQETFILVTMQLATRWLDRLFGERLFSWRAFDASFCLAPTCICLLLALGVALEEP